MTTIDLKISPLPPQDAGRQCVFDAPVLQAAMRAVMRLNGVVPVSKVVISQAAGFPGRDVNQFQVFLADARCWLDLVEFFSGDFARPALTRESEGFQFTHAEWTAIVDVRAAMLAAHNALGQPDLIQLTLSSASTSTVLNAQPSAAVHGEDELVVGWHAPNAGHLDWVALCLVGSPNTSFVAYKYVPDGQADGEFEFATPATPGSYEFRYLVANSYVDVARSAPIDVS